MQLELIKFIASYKPLIAGAKVSERIDAIIKNLLLSSMQPQVWLLMLSLFGLLSLQLSSFPCHLMFYNNAGFVFISVLLFWFLGISCHGKHAIGSGKRCKLNFWRVKWDHRREFWSSTCIVQNIWRFLKISLCILGFPNLEFLKSASYFSWRVTSAASFSEMDWANLCWSSWTLLGCIGSLFEVFPRCSWQRCQ